MTKKGKENENYGKCENCLIHYLKGNSHECDGLMKMLVKNYKQKNKKVVK